MNWIDTTFAKLNIPRVEKLRSSAIVPPTQELLGNNHMVFIDGTNITALLSCIQAGLVDMYFWHNQMFLLIIL